MGERVKHGNGTAVPYPEWRDLPEQKRGYVANVHTPDGPGVVVAAAGPHGFVLGTRVLVLDAMGGQVLGETVAGINEVILSPAAHHEQFSAGELERVGLPIRSENILSYSASG